MMVQIQDLLIAPLLRAQDTCTVLVKIIIIETRYTANIIDYIIREHWYWFPNMRDVPQDIIKELRGMALYASGGEAFPQSRTLWKFLIQTL